MNLLEIDEANSKKALLIISRQHPPEVTGFIAMKSFIETIAGDSEQAKVFRQKFKVYNVPLMNPDGVDNGHWRHNMGGIDLNRDWQAFNQPETRAVLIGYLQKRRMFRLQRSYNLPWSLEIIFTLCMVCRLLYLNWAIIHRVTF